MGSLLSELAAAVNGQLDGADITVFDVTHDSRKVGPGTLFVAVKGAVFDGHDFIDGAAESGASAFVVEHLTDTKLPQLLVPDCRAAMGFLADIVHGHPSQGLTVVGITGTNGKTTVSYMLEAIGRAAGVPAAAIGTTGLFVDGVLTSLGRTTPEASDLHRMLAQLRDEGVRLVALEVSSHAIALHRVAGVHFAAAGFTNLSQDHLDFHHDMESYFQTKAEFVGRAPLAVINVESSYGQRLAEQVPSLEVGKDLTAEGLKLFETHSTFSMALGDERADVDLPMGGRFNVENALVAAGLALYLGLELPAVAEGLTNSSLVPGRFETILGLGFTVVVDYAHTPDGITAVIAAAREITSGRVIAVFGAGGDRDRDKRRPMGLAATSADLVIATSDNPRNEDASGIIQQVCEGLEEGGAVFEVKVDRREAIQRSIELARPGDIVLILGKGHEATQEIMGVAHRFDDRQVVRDLLGVAP
jgi:UDP-N-acetylmuramoyl-L-alanyl-D-glutamate--2,6-diaminopimelate ligase